MATVTGAAAPGARLRTRIDRTLPYAVRWSIAKPSAYRAGAPGSGRYATTHALPSASQPSSRIAATPETAASVGGGSSRPSVSTRRSRHRSPAASWATNASEPSGSQAPLPASAVSGGSANEEICRPSGLLTRTFVPTW
ncbi:hypothetical protein [Micromonospora aurantiaca (nom. illeg.)]|uniref:hypothetical protein n=1 Tax=Micromonospora aurantiaca (nom. illeg.) TaxID=47850 RepID=UPI000828CE23|nr:hypothetical protein [Micromonospora aurantiaca]SCL42487.1 hypothetical protein GA0070615_5643 [Micromonospora aurantiaca]